MNEFFYRYTAEFYSPTNEKCAVVQKVSLVVKTATTIPNYKTSLMVKEYLAEQLKKSVKILHMKTDRLELMTRHQAEVECVVPLDELKPLDLSEYSGRNRGSL